VAAVGAPPDGRGVAAAVDGEVVPRGSWESHALTAEDRVEVLRAVQGG
jgi:sulfur carrier protein